MKNSAILYVSAVLLFLFATSVGATTITFDPLELPGSGFQTLHSYSESGYTFISSRNTSSDFAAAQQGNAAWYYGSASLFNNAGNAITTLTKDDNGVFDFISVDLAPVSKGLPKGATVEFTGQLHDGGNVTESFTVSTYSLQTFTFSAFDKLDSVSWAQINPFHTFDNLVLDSTSNIPEPSSLAMLGLGLAGLATTRRKK